MADIRIERTTDYHDCDTCGLSMAEGANVSVDGHLVIELKPHASCFEQDSYSDREVFAAILNLLGHTVSIDDEHVEPPAD